VCYVTDIGYFNSHRCYRRYVNITVATFAISVVEIAARMLTELCRDYCLFWGGGGLFQIRAWSIGRMILSWFLAVIRVCTRVLFTERLAGLSDKAQRVSA
jgi:hypothetical protein